MEKREYDVAVIGGGPAGYTAALYCARSGMKTAVLEKLSAGGQMSATDRIDNYPGFGEGIDGFELGERMRSGAEKSGAETIYEEAAALSVGGDGKKKILTRSGGIAASAVIAAVGARARELGLPGERSLVGRGIAYCAACDGARYKGKRVVVVGGGNTAVGDALYLSGICEKVTLVHRRDSLRAPAARLKELEAHGVEVVWNSLPSALLYGDRLTGVRLRDVRTGEEREISCDGLFAAIGRTPETELFKGILTLDEGGYIVADETTRTNVPGVFAAGDARTKPVRQIVTAAADGAVAAHFAEQYLRSL